MRREAGLRLCECGHCRAYHRVRPRYYGGPATEGEPCAFCRCGAYAEGEYQGMRMHSRRADESMRAGPDGYPPELLEKIL